MKKVYQLVLIIMVLVFMDQTSKFWALNYWPEFDGNSFYQSGCTTAVGRMLNHRDQLFGWFTSLFGIYLIALFWTSRIPMPILALWTAGGLSNLMEMMFRGYVVDFLVLRWGNGAIIGNIADCYIVIAIIALAVSAPFLKWKDLVIGSRFDIKY